MTARLIAVAITPHEDGKRCGECIGVTTDPSNEYCAWAEQNWDETHKGPFLKNLGDTRGPQCLAAERALRDVVEAGKTLRAYLAFLETSVSKMHAAAWDAALASLERLREEGK